MLVVIVLGLVLLGAVLGGAGMRRLGRWAGQASGRWRPGTGMAAIIFAFGGLALSVRGAWIFGLPLLAVSGGLALLTRKRPGATTPSPARMSEDEARAVLGVSIGASKKDVQAAYLRLMQRAHPDKGGTTGLAIQLNAARKTLIG
jgi:hypothetical protein